MELPLVLMADVIAIMADGIACIGQNVRQML